MFIPSRCQGPVSIAIAVCQKLSNAAWTKLVVACATQQHCKGWMLFSQLWNETRGTGRETPDTFTIDNWQVFTLLTLGAFCSDWFLWIDSVCCLLAFLTGLMISLWRLLCVWHPNWIQELQVSGPKKDFKKYLEEIDFHGHKSALWAALDVKQDGYITVACQVQAYPTVFFMLRIWPDVTRGR